MQQAYVRNLRARYMRMRDSAIEQQIEGFSQWEFLQQAGVTLMGEARDLYDEFMENWDALNPACTNKRRAETAEIDRARHILHVNYFGQTSSWSERRVSC